MKKFMFLLRADFHHMDMSDEEGEVAMKEWMAWYALLKEKNQFADPGNPLVHDGAVVTQTEVTNELVQSNRGMVGGYLVVQAADLDGAVKIAQGSPGLKDWEIEVREITEIM